MQACPSLFSSPGDEDVFRDQQSKTDQTIVSSSLAYPSVFSMTIWLSAFSLPSSTPILTWFGKYIRPSLIAQPLLCAKETTAPSLSKKSRFLVEEIGRDGYAVSLHEAISLRICEVKIYVINVSARFAGEHQEQARGKKKVNKPR